MKIRSTITLLVSGLLWLAVDAQAMSSGSTLNDAINKIYSPISSPQNSPQKTGAVTNALLQSKSKAARVLFGNENNTQKSPLKRTASTAGFTVASSTDGKENSTSITTVVPKKPRYEVTKLVYSQDEKIIPHVIEEIKKASTGSSVDSITPWGTHPGVRTAFKKAQKNGAQVTVYPSKAKEKDKKENGKLVAAGVTVNQLGYETHSKTSLIYNDAQDEATLIVSSRNYSNIPCNTHDDQAVFVNLNGSSPVKEAIESMAAVKQFSIPLTATGSPEKIKSTNGSPEKYVGPSTSWQKYIKDAQRTVLDTTPEKDKIIDTVRYDFTNTFAKRFKKPASAHEKQDYSVVAMNLTDPTLITALKEQAKALKLGTQDAQGSISVIVNGKPLSKKAAEQLEELQKHAIDVRVVEKGQVELHKKIQGLEHAKVVTRAITEPGKPTHYLTIPSTANFTEQGFGREINHALILHGKEVYDKQQAIIEKIKNQKAASKFVPPVQSTTTTSTTTKQTKPKKASTKKANVQAVTQAVVANTKAQSTVTTTAKI
jgi:hypothetical protein